MKDPGDHLSADHEHQRDEDGDLGEGDPERRRDLACGGRARCPSGSAEQARNRRQQHQGQHHRQILDDQPADGDAPLLGLDETPFLQSPQQHHRARDRKREPKDQARAELPAKAPPQPHSERGGEGDLTSSARHGDAADREKILQGKVQADAKHQQDDANLGEVAGQRRIGDESRRERADQHAGEEVARQRRNPYPMGQRPKNKGEDEASNDRSDQRRVMRHRISKVRARAPEREKKVFECRPAAAYWPRRRAGFRTAAASLCRQSTAA